MKLLLSHDKPDFAMDIASRAFLLSDDKTAFRQEGWVDQLVKQSIERADKFDQDEEWIRSLRIYSDLAVIEPSVPTWKDRLKLSTRRVRLLAMYTPESLKALQSSEIKEREQVEQLLRPTTQPATQPASTQAAKDAPANVETFKIDWHDTLRGVRMDMLWEALVDADQNYYRGVSYKDLATGGIRGLRALATTKGLEKAFPKLGDADRRGGVSDHSRQA